MAPRRFGITLAVLLLLGRPAAAEPAPVCDETTPLAVLGLDTAAGRVLFSLAAPDGTARLIELSQDSAGATSFRSAPGAEHFAGSVGPGPVFALARCGDGCVAAERWEAGAWRALGEPLPVPADATFAPTYDREGNPWLLAHRPISAPGWVEARACRFAGGGWREQGRLAVRAVGAPAAAPAPWLGDGVVSGTGLFPAEGEPRTWVEGLPLLPPEKEGQVVALDASSAAYLAADGGVYLSADAGATWSGSRWKPWGVAPREIWTLGTDYDLDLPLGALGAPLPLAWFDRRPGRQAALYLTEVSAAGAWTLRAALAPELDLPAVGRVEPVHFLRTAAGTWLLATDCFAAAETPSIAVVALTAAGPQPARVLAVR